MVCSTPVRNPFFALPLALDRTHATAIPPGPDLFGRGDLRLVHDTFVHAGFSAIAILEFRALSVAAFME